MSTNATTLAPARPALQTATVKRKPSSRTRTNLIMDGIIFVMFVLASAPHTTGKALHEWLGIAVAATIVVHLLLHWQWMVQVTRRFFGRMPANTRINWVLNALLFVAITLVSVSGMMISEELLPLLGLQGAGGGMWTTIHTTSAEVIPLLAALHVALHWGWIATAVKRYVLQPLGGVVRLVRPVRTAGAESEAAS